MIPSYWAVKSPASCIDNVSYIKVLGGMKFGESFKSVNDTKLLFLHKSNLSSRWHLISLLSRVIFVNNIAYWWYLVE